MSADNLQILYVGNPIAGHTFSICGEPLGWSVYVAESRMEALGMFISYLPHVVVLDTSLEPAMVEEVYYHIRTVDRTPVIVLDYVNRLAWAALAGKDETDVLHVIPAATPFSTLAELILEFFDTRAVVS